MTLAEAAKPRIFSTQKWYKDSAQALQKYQAEAVRRDDAAEQERKQKYIDLLKVLKIIVVSMKLILF